MGAFGTDANPTHFVEYAGTAIVGNVPDRPAAGTTLSVRNSATLVALPSITVGAGGHWSATYAGVDAIDVSPDSGVTWTGPLLDRTTALTPASKTPAYAGRRAGFFDPAASVYNADHYRDAATLTKLAGTQLASKAFNLGIVGASTASGTGDTTGYGWSRRLQTLLANAGCAVSGTGWVFLGQALSNGDSRITKSTSPAPTQQLARHRANIPNGGWVQFASDVAGTEVSVRWVGNASGAFTVSIDGGTAVAVTPSGLSENQIYTVSGLTDATHTVKITATTATAAQPSSVRVHRPAVTGLQISNGGLGGSKTADWLTSVYGQAMPEFQTVAADHTLVMIGAGDAFATTSGGSTSTVPVATYAANLAAMVDALRAAGSGVTLIAQTQCNPLFLTPAQWEVFVSAMYDVADAKGCGLIDIHHRWRDYTTGNNAALYNADTVHPSAAGHIDIASVVAGYLGA